MPRGGPRNRGPLTRSHDSPAALVRRAGAVVLPRDGHQGDPPPFVLPDATDRELAVWRQAWTSPQAAAWAVDSWRWRTVALWVRWSVRVEDPDASAALGNVVMRLADQIGMTPAGLAECGWRIADPGESSSAAGRVTADTRSQRAAFSMRERLAQLDEPGRDEAEPRLSSLERARRRAEERAQGPDAG